jgi:hypothetical protein
MREPSKISAARPRARGAFMIPRHRRGAFQQRIEGLHLRQLQQAAL